MFKYSYKIVRFIRRYITRPIRKFIFLNIWCVLTRGKGDPDCKFGNTYVLEELQDQIDMTNEAIFTLEDMARKGTISLRRE